MPEYEKREKHTERLYYHYADHSASNCDRPDTLGPAAGYHRHPLGADGEANGWSDKAHAVFFLPCMLAVIHLIAAAVVLADPKRKNIHRKPMMLTLWIVPVISLITNGSTYVIALGADLNMSVFLCLVIGIVFILLGNYMPKLQQNYTVGIKVPWTLNSEGKLEPHPPAGRQDVCPGRHYHCRQRFHQHICRGQRRVPRHGCDRNYLLSDSGRIFLLAFQERNIAGFCNIFAVLCKSPF